MQGKEQNISPIKQRILFFASTLGISKRDFYAKIGVSRGTLESKTGITEDVVTKFFATYPEVSVEWLMTGEGEMLKNSPSCKEKNKKNIDKEEKNAEVSYNPVIGKPYYDVDFLGGFNEIVNSQVTIPTNNIVIQGFEKADFWCNVTGHSMEPKINMVTLLPSINAPWRTFNMGKSTLSYLIHYAPSRYSVGRQIQRSCVSFLSIRQTMTSKNTQ